MVERLDARICDNPPKIIGRNLPVKQLWLRPLSAGLLMTFLAFLALRSFCVRALDTDPVSPQEASSVQAGTDLEQDSLRGLLALGQYGGYVAYTVGL